MSAINKGPYQRVPGEDGGKDGGVSYAPVNGNDNKIAAAGGWIAGVRATGKFIYEHPFQATIYAGAAAAAVVVFTGPTAVGAAVTSIATRVFSNYVEKDKRDYEQAVHAAEDLPELRGVLEHKYSASKGYIEEVLKAIEKQGAEIKRTAETAKAIEEYMKKAMASLQMVSGAGNSKQEQDNEHKVKGDNVAASSAPAVERDKEIESKRKEEVDRKILQLEAIVSETQKQYLDIQAAQGTTGKMIDSAVTLAKKAEDEGKNANSICERLSKYQNAISKQIEELREKIAKSDKAQEEKLKATLASLENQRGDLINKRAEAERAITAARVIEVEIPKIKEECAKLGILIATRTEDLRKNMDITLKSAKETQEMKKRIDLLFRLVDRNDEAISRGQASGKSRFRATRVFSFS